MVVINPIAVKEMYYASLMYEMHKTKEKIKFFAKRYNLSFSELEKEIKSSKKEEPTKWDDYIEWKAYEKILKKCQKEKQDLEIGHYQVSGK